MTYKIKQDGYVGGIRIIEFAAERLGQAMGTHSFLSDYFDGATTLIPVPRSSPLVKPDDRRLHSPKSLFSGRDARHVNTSSVESSIGNSVHGLYRIIRASLRSSVDR